VKAWTGKGARSTVRLLPPRESRVLVLRHRSGEGEGKGSEDVQAVESLQAGLLLAALCGLVSSIQQARDAMTARLMMLQVFRLLILEEIRQRNAPAAYARNGMKGVTQTSRQAD